MIPTNFSSVDLRSVELAQDQLNKCCGDKNTKLKPGFTIPLCKEILREWPLNMDYLEAISVGEK